MSLRLSTTGLLCALALACGAKPRADPVVLALGDEVVRRGDFERYLGRLEANGAVFDADVRAALFETFLQERIVVLEARSRKLLAEGSTPEHEDEVVRQLLAAAAHEAPAVEEREVAARYEQDVALCQTPETVTLRQVLASTPNEARDVRRRLLRQPRNFEVVARAISQAPEAAQGGLMGTFARGQLPPELEDVAFALAPGALSDVITTPFGHHVLRVEARDPARELSLETCRDKIHAVLSRERADSQVRLFVAALLARAKVNHDVAKLTPLSR